jgi:hypothetical protein
MASVGAEPGQDLGVGELAEAVLGPVLGAEEHGGGLAGGEHPVLADQGEDGPVAVGEAAGEAGELVGHPCATAGVVLLVQQAISVRSRGR